MLALIRRKEKGEKSPFSIEHMSFTNLGTKLIQNGQQTFGSFPDNRPLSTGFVFLKFAWEVEISMEGSDPKGLSSTGPLIAKTCELPRWSVDTQIVNVYNHKTIVQTKMSYETTTMSFYDQSSGAAETLIWEFIKAQFDPSDGSKAATFKPLTVKITMKDLSGEAKDKIYTLRNAYIVDAQHDTLDYSTSDPVLWTITLRYEDLETNEFKGTTPKVSTGIAALPKPPKKVLPSSNSFDQLGKKVKADTAAEVSKWVQAGGKDTGGGAAYGNPNMVNKYKTKPVATTAWPTSPSIVSRIANAFGFSSPGTTSSTPATPSTTNTQIGFSPSTGTSATTNAKQLPMTPRAKLFITNEENRIKNMPDVNPEWKTAYIAALKEMPPQGVGTTSQNAAKMWAMSQASKKAPMQVTQSRTTDSGINSTASGGASREPTSPGVRQGTTQINPKTNDTLTPVVLTTQARRERDYKSYGTAAPTGGNKAAFGREWARANSEMQ